MELRLGEGLREVEVREMGIPEHSRINANHNGLKTLEDLASQDALGWSTPFLLKSNKSYR